MPKSNCFRKIFGSERNHGSQTLPKSVCQNFYPNFPLIQNKLSWKTCPAIISKFLGLFIRTLTPDNMHSPHNWEKFRQRLQRQLSQKRKLISGIFVAFLKSAWNFVYFEKKNQLQSLNIFGVLHSEKFSSLNVKKQLLQNKLRAWAHSRFPNTAQIGMAAVLS